MDRSWAQIVALGLAIVIAAMLSAIIVTKPWAERDDLRQLRIALIKMDAAASVGTQMDDFSHLAADAVTATELARGSLNEPQQKKVGEALESAAGVLTYWREIGDEHISQTAMDSLIALKAVTPEQGAAILSNDFRGELEAKMPLRKRLLGIALTEMALKVRVAIDALNAA